MGYAPICQVRKCPEKTAIRLADPENKKRVDLCYGHGIKTVEYYKDEIVIVDTWNDTEPEDYQDEE